MKIKAYLDNVLVSELQVGDFIVRPWDVHYISSISNSIRFKRQQVNLKQLGSGPKDLVDKLFSVDSVTHKVCFGCQKFTVVRYPKEYFLALNESVRAFKKKINAIRVSSETALSEIIAAIHYSMTGEDWSKPSQMTGYDLARYNQELDLYRHIKTLVQNKLEYCKMSQLGESVPIYATQYNLAECILAGDTLDKLRERNKICADAHAEIDRLNQVIRDAWKVTT